MRVIIGLACAALLAGCVDSNVQARIDACNKVQDETLRVQCLKDVPVTTAPEKP